MKKQEGHVLIGKTIGNNSVETLKEILKNENFTTGISTCKYELQCGWCDKFDRICDKYTSLK